MNNPFQGMPNAVTLESNLIGRKEILQKMDEWISEKQFNVVIQGPWGTGKTSVMNVFFNEEYRIKMAKQQTLFCHVSFPLLKDSDEIYHLLTDAVIDSLGILYKCGMIAKLTLDFLRKKCDEIRKTSVNGASRYTSTLSFLSRDQKYRLVIIMDDLQHFTTSDKVTAAHHDILRRIVRQPGVNMQYVVATDFDLNDDSVSQEAKGSMWLHDLAKNIIVVQGFTMLECADYLNEYTLGTNVVFQESELKAIWDLTAGNPTLLRIAARHAYDMKAILEETLGDDEWAEIGDQVYDEAQELLKNWCSPMPKQQIELMRMLAQEPDSKVERDMSGHVTALINRDLVEQSVRMRGNQSFPWPGHYCVRGKLLQRFCLEPGQLEAAAESSPLRRPKAQPAVSVPTVFTVAAESKDISTLLRETLSQLSSLTDDDAREDVANQIREICTAMDLPAPYAMKDILRDEVLYEYALTLDTLNQYSKKTRAFIINGIFTDMNLRDVTLELDDNASSSVNFAKAIETHMNETLLPVIKWALPTQKIRENSRDVCLKDMTKQRLMLGEMSYILNRGRHMRSVQSCAEDLGQACISFPGKFSESWWKKLADQLDKIQALRNKVPHPDLISSEECKKLLQLAFRGEKCFMNSCTAVYDAAKKSGVI